MSNKQIKSKKRVVEHGEVFTSDREVNAMLDLMKQETDRIDSRFLEPACGDGNFLAEILRRKLKMVKERYQRSPSEYEKYAVVAVTSIYGVDLLQDNVNECRERLFGIFDKEYTAICKKEANESCRETVRFLLKRNILCGDALTLKAADGEPIIFSEWSLITGAMMKRRDFRLDELMGDPTDLISIYDSNMVYDDETNAFIPTPIQEFPLIHYRRLQENE
ncbi:SAM-dependent DNA methyltransferase [Cohnella sp. AR92]|uniref:SAM-dependent DNA methyltransferase n=1 Tax=Cohnella sp. AR92 TaxID=648716 RepID=UPI000F8D1F9C|nr:SAM-dependent DNA methyltransferase [Cohnella sp. AR92]RUS48584.1 SAM-dependent DNA methyltransferase [Cohnella sp. AR92]